MNGAHYLFAALLGLALTGCAAEQASLALPSDAALGSSDPLISAAALLVAAEAAEDADARAPLIARLDALGVAAVPGTDEDRLADWRREYRPPAGEVYRGRTLGPGYRRAQLAAGERMVIDQIFYAGQRAEMAAQTRGGQPVVLAVTGSQAQKVCEAQLTPNARCRWLPIFTERFSITLINRGTTPASVYLVFE